MIRKIICPTDLSPAAQNAVAYAAKLCQLTGSNLELLHIEPVRARDLVFSGHNREHAIAEMSEALNKVCYEVSKMFNISCSSEIDTSGLPLDEAVARKADEDTLVVAGTNGADNLFELIFGSNAFNIAKQAFSNVLIIPEDISYGTIRTLAFAWDYEVPTALIHKIKELAVQLQCKLIFLHISKHASEISNDVFHAMQDKLAGSTGEKEEINFKRIYASDIQQALDNYMKEEKVDVLAVSLKKGNLLRKAFRSVNNVGSYPSYPVLVIHTHTAP